MSTTSRPAPPSPDAAWAYFLDLDGTLVPFGDTPDGVVVPPVLPGLLVDLAGRTEGAVAIISGRPLAGMDRLLRQPHLAAAGVHGFERRRADGVLVETLAPETALERVRGALHAFAERHPGLLVEEKGIALALHFRRVPAEGEAATRFCTGLAESVADTLRLRHGKHVLEFTPHGSDKGTAIEAFLAEPPFSGRRPVFIGDDVTDEDGFRMVNRLGGLSIRVGDDRPSEARYGLIDVAAVLDWLRRPLG